MYAPIEIGRYYEAGDEDDGSSTDDELENSDYDGEDDSDKDDSDDEDLDGDYDTDEELVSEDDGKVHRQNSKYWTDIQEMEEDAWWWALAPEYEDT